MARRRTKKTLSEHEIAELKDRAIALHKACIDPMSSLRTDAEHYAPLRDLALSIADALGKITGNSQPFYRGWR